MTGRKLGLTGGASRTALGILALGVASASFGAFVAAPEVGRRIGYGPIGTAHNSTAEERDRILRAELMRQNPPLNSSGMSSPDTRLASTQLPVDPVERTPSLTDEGHADAVASSPRVPDAPPGVKSPAGSDDISSSLYVRGTVPANAAVPIQKAVAREDAQPSAQLTSTPAAAEINRTAKETSPSAPPDRTSGESTATDKLRPGLDSKAKRKPSNNLDVNFQQEPFVAKALSGGTNPVLGGRNNRKHAGTENSAQPAFVETSDEQSSHRASATGTARATTDSQRVRTVKVTDQERPVPGNKSVSLAGTPVAEQPVAAEEGKLFHVRVGKFGSREEAEKARDDLKRQAGVTAFLVRGQGGFQLQTGAYKHRGNAEKIAGDLRTHRFQPEVTQDQ